VKIRLAGTLALLLLATDDLNAQPLRISPAPGSPFPAGPAPLGTIVVDVDTDGAVDIVVANTTAGSVTVLWGNGRGNFGTRPPSTFPAMTDPHLLAWGDFNQDRRPDLVVTNHDSNSATVLFNDRGRFPAQRRVNVQAFDDRRTHNHGLAVADLNNDGWPDITMGHQDLDSIAVVLGGRGAFRRHSRIPVGRSPYPHVIADFNGDKWLDIVVPNVRDDSVSILLGSRQGLTATGERVRVAARPFFVVPADLDRDGDIDFVLSHDDSDSLTILLAEAGARFRQERFDMGMRTWKIALADLNGDKIPDLAVGSNGTVRLFLGDGRGGFGRATSVSAGSDSWEVILQDVNGDGRPDVIAPNRTLDSVSVFLAH
jgi:hypothetical protein